MDVDEKSCMDCKHDSNQVEDPDNDYYMSPRCWKCEDQDLWQDKKI